MHWKNFRARHDGCHRVALVFFTAFGAGAKAAEVQAHEVHERELERCLQLSELKMPSLAYEDCVGGIDLRDALCSYNCSKYTSREQCKNWTWHLLAEMAISFKLYLPVAVASKPRVTAQSPEKQAHTDFAHAACRSPACLTWLAGACMATVRISQLLESVLSQGPVLSCLHDTTGTSALACDVSVEHISEQQTRRNALLRDIKPHTKQKW